MANQMRRVELLIAVARYVFDEGRILIGVGIGEDEVGNDLGFQGELDNIPSDAEAYRWANACIRLIRYVVTHLGPAIAEYNENNPGETFETIMSAIEDEIE